jgi:hypothetical protein
MTDKDALFEDLVKEHVDRMEQVKLLKELIHQIKDNKPLSDHGNVARMVAKLTKGYCSVANHLLSTI